MHFIMIISHSVSVVKQLYAITCLFRDVNANLIANNFGIEISGSILQTQNKNPSMHFLNPSLEMQMNCQLLMTR